MLPTLLLSLSLAAEPTCTPVLHGGLELPEGPSVSRVDWLGGTQDGTRVGLLASRANSRSTLVYTVDSRDTESPDMPPDPPPGLEAHIDTLRADRSWLAEQGLNARSLPQPIPWCPLGDGGIRLDEGRLEFELWDEPCDGGTQRQWKICAQSSGERRPEDCVVAPSLPKSLCWTEAPRLVDVYRLGEVLWFVVERPRERSTPRMAAGLRRR